MLISYEWLKKMVDASGVSASDAAAKITARGLEVEGMKSDPTVIGDIRVAKLIKVEAHPNSDHLHLVDVDAGTGELIRVVCGAPGIEEGWVVPFAPIGADLGNGFKIKKSKLRGEVSNGMLCSEKELGLGNDDGTLLRLSADAPLGAPLADVLGMGAPESVAPFHRDIFEIGLTPDRGDCLSHRGVARELAAALHTALHEPETADLSKIPGGHFVEVESGEDCPRYMGIEIDNVKVGPSPAWLRRAVEACGARSVNNVVDVTNFVCFELGHPMHAFDCDKLGAAKIAVRRAKAGETLKAINHETYELSENDIVITDGVKPVAIAGVMGGVDTEVDETTTRIIFEIATFHPTCVRKTSKRLGLHSESSHRYERFVDPEGIARAAGRAVWLLARTQAEAPRLCALDDCYQKVQRPCRISLRPSRVCAILGVPFSNEALESLLRPIGFSSECWTAETIEVDAPTWRSDITREIDIIEEICRGYGFDNFPAALPDVAMKCVHKKRASVINPTPYPLSPNIWEREPRARLHALREALIGMGLNECMHYTFMDPQDPARMNAAPDSPVSRPMKLANPMSVENSVMRTTMVPSMLNALAKNMANQQKSCTLFEVGEVFFPVSAGDGIVCLEEARRLCMLFWGEQPKPWHGAARAWDVYDLKGCLEEALERVGARVTIEQSGDASWLHDGIQAVVRYNGEPIGHLGELHPVVARNYKLEGPVFVAEVDIEPLIDARTPPVRMTPLARFHFSSRDLSIVVPVTVTFKAIRDVIESVRPEYLESWQLFDVYRGKQILPGLQSISMNFRYRHPLAYDPEKGRPLTDEEINGAHAVIVEALNERLGGVIR